MKETDFDKLFNLLLSFGLQFGDIENSPTSHFTVQEDKKHKFILVKDIISESHSEFAFYSDGSFFRLYTGQIDE